MDEAALGVLTEENGETHDGDVQWFIIILIVRWIGPAVNYYY